jgi:hypothetical protein
MKSTLSNTSALSNALEEAFNNQLAQVCNNLYCIIKQVKKYRFSIDNEELDNIYIELQVEYNTLFKLIYGE